MLIALLFAYIGHLKDNVAETVSSLFCTLQSTEILTPFLPSVYKPMETPGGTSEMVKTECSHSNQDIMVIKVFPL